MTHKALVLSDKSVGGTDATDHGLDLGTIVTVVGFVGNPADMRAVVIHNGYYYTVPDWMLKPEPIEETVPA